jgi:hypothetical protein
VQAGPGGAPSHPRHCPRPPSRPSRTRARWTAPTCPGAWSRAPAPSRWCSAGRSSCGASTRGRLARNSDSALGAGELAAHRPFFSGPLRKHAQTHTDGNGKSPITTDSRGMRRGTPLRPRRQGGLKWLPCGKEPVASQVRRVMYRCSKTVAEFSTRYRQYSPPVSRPQTFENSPDKGSNCPFMSTETRETGRAGTTRLFITAGSLPFTMI